MTHVNLEYQTFTSTLANWPKAGVGTFRNSTLRYGKDFRWEVGGGKGGGAGKVVTWYMLLILKIKKKFDGVQVHNERSFRS